MFFRVSAALFQEMTTLLAAYLINYFKGNLFIRLKKKNNPSSQPSATHPTGVFLFQKKYGSMCYSEVVKYYAN